MKISLQNNTIVLFYVTICNLYILLTFVLDSPENVTFILLGYRKNVGRVWLLTDKSL